MFNTRPAAVFLTLLMLSVSGFAQSAASSGSSGSAAGLRTPIIRLTEVREGMRGTARTVFRGTEPEDFNVEIIGVLPGGVGPKQDLIIGRLSGGGADRTAVFAGMSGSPVYVDGKLIGAISYSFPFSKEPICGITPIEQMIEIFEAKEPARRTSAPQAISFAEIASASLPELTHRVDTGLLAATTSTNPMMASIAGQTFRPIGVPLTFNGISQQTLDAFAPQLMRAGLVPVAAAGGTSPIAPMKAADENTLKPGASVSMQLTRGDYSLASSGTVTLREGERIYAFGHPFLSL
ncbi:MAG TPA: SpoIVB peptidase S55 domain-containing protein, partial [Pyrinomonadaceae bacterium]|nr:SpoIVB peptidase S55 domain-containing protein [Pyrinomonadaceae bacterium]